MDDLDQLLLSHTNIADIHLVLDSGLHVGDQGRELSVLGKPRSQQPRALLDQSV